MKYLVTGGAGFIGSNIVDRLISTGNKVIIIDDFSLGREENIEHLKNNPNLTVYRKSICEDLSEIFGKEKIDGVFHLAALPRVQYSIENPIESHNVNVNGYLNVLNHCRKFGVKRVVFSSSSAIYGDTKDYPTSETSNLNPMSPYAIHKLIGEEYGKLFSVVYGLEVINLRYFNAYGPKQDPKGAYALIVTRFIDMIYNGQPPVINGDGENTRDYIYVGDVVDANILAMKTGNRACIGQSFNIGSGRDISVNKITEEIIKLSKKEVTPIHGPSVVEPKCTLADYRKAKEMLDWKPRVQFEDGLRVTYENYLRDQNKVGFT
ncbi:MAG: GDP-mannose 4,6-dehydratase [Candidatus Nanoarchaeia archaeon]|nr:GDP-mannose 4,6-dehydratase [Candidatus Nanoarchaeia archaeon]